MSGEHYECFHWRIMEMADKVMRDAERYDHLKPETLARFKECSDTLDLASRMLNRVDWLLSGDDSEDSFHLRWDATVRPSRVATVQDCAVAVQAERDAVVEWLRTLAIMRSMQHPAQLADEIEQGVHTWRAESIPFPEVK